MSRSHRVCKSMKRGEASPLHTTSDLIQTFISLAPASETTVGTHPVIFHKQNTISKRGKGTHGKMCTTKEKWERYDTTGIMIHISIISALETMYECRFGG